MPPTRTARTSRPDLVIQNRAVAALRASPRNARTHSPAQVAQIAASIEQFGFVTPVLVGSDDRIIAGHGRLEAARSLGVLEVPTLSLAHLSQAEQRAYALADNKLAENAGWNFDLLKLELVELDGLELDFSLEITGFNGADLDTLMFSDPDEAKADEAPAVRDEAVSRTGDVWMMGDHRLLCADALDPGIYARLTGEEPARMVFADPPYNVPVDGHVRRRDGGHREFGAAAGEMSPADFQTFLATSLGLSAQACMPGAILFACMDWRHMAEMLPAGREVGLELKNLVVWAKPNAGLGQFYRSQHELIAVFKKPGAAHLNTFGMGRGGRHRTNVWTYPGVNSFHADRDEELAMHPTVKPSAMIADAIKDVSRRGDIVLDPFGGSGTTLIAAEKTRRRARLVEIDPLYCDVACRRWRAFSGQPAMLAETGESFEAVAAGRLALNDEEAH